MREERLLVNVFEAVNQDLKECFIACTSSSGVDASRVIAVRPGWKKKHRIDCRIVIGSLPLDRTAPLFIEDYARAMRVRGWITTTDLRHWP